MVEKQHQQRHFIPREATVAELEGKAADAEEKATNESEPHATELREEAKLYRELSRMGRIPAVRAVDVLNGS